MKTITTILFVLSLTISITPNAQADAVGFECKHAPLQIVRHELADGVTLAIKNTEAGTLSTNTEIFLPKDNSTSSYQDRVGFYYSLMGSANSYFPYMPGPLLVYHITRSTKLYRMGFMAFEGKGEPVKLAKIYCEALMQAITNYPR